MSIYGAWRALGSPPTDQDARLSRELAGRVWQFARPYRLHIAGLLAAIVVASLLSAVTPLLYRAVIDDAIIGRQLRLLHLLAAAILTVAAGGALAQVAARLFSSRIGERVVFDLRVALFDHVQQQPVAFFARTQTGALTSRLTTDLVGGHRVFTETLSAVAQTVLGVVVTLAAMLLLDWRLTLLALAIAPLFVAVARRMRGRLHRLMGAQLAASADLTSQMTERFQVGGALLVKLFGRPDLELQRFERSAGRLRDIGVETAVLSRVFHVAFALVSGVGIGLVYWVGGLLVISGSVSLGTIVAFTAYLTQLYTPLTMLANARVDLAAALVSFQRVFEVLDFPPTIVEADGAIELRRPKGSVEFEHVWFRHPSPSETTIVSLEGEAVDSGYDEDAWVLCDVSFRVEPGRTVALVGPSGAGKTTITMLVPRMYDVTRGAVRVDGHDVRDLTLSSLSRAVGVVSQDTHLFHDSVRHNLLYAKPDATESELIEAARAARIHELIASLPDGYDTLVGERGYRFSGGEKQRLAIARLLLRDPAIVLLDEATAHLDSESEVLIRRALGEALAGRSSLVIAHRLSTIVDADLILVLDRGRIVERGTHEELLAAGGLYRQLHRMQFDRSAVG
ncbi:MAG: ABC transporter ATP-binding protein [Nitriliruptorales bacterium]